MLGYSHIYIYIYNGEIHSMQLVRPRIIGPFDDAVQQFLVEQPIIKNITIHITHTFTFRL